MRTSLIITTYNWKEALAISLDSALAQRQLPDEIIVADDGSTEDTAEVVRIAAAKASIPIIHSWQEDDGFRLAESRNKAIAKATGDYVVLIDGDILLHRCFIRDHCRFARPGYFSQGTRVLLDAEISRRILAEKQFNICFASRGLHNRKNCIHSDLLAQICSYRSRSLHGIKTCNFAFWRSNALQVNGFNEEFIGWGREDSEFTARLMNCGVQRQNIKFNALGYHLFHAINNRERLEVNNLILKATIDQRLTWCAKGIDRYL